MNWFIDGLRIVCAWFCEIIYMLIANLYQLFINISRVELLTSKQIYPIYQRITMILTIVMVFYVTFETVKFVIQPERFSDKEKGASKIVLRMGAVVLLIAFVPQIFSGAYWIQNKIFDTQVFSKVILGKQNVNSDEFGKNLSYNILSMFYSLDTESFPEDELEKGKCGDSNIPCKQLVLMNYNQLQTEGKVEFLTEGLDAYGEAENKDTGERVNKYKINFNAIFALGVGGFIAYMLLLYCVDAGVRVVQLLFLQIIAPIPIIAYLAPKKDGMFEKWTKQCVTTYLDLFLRVGIIYFILLICQILGNGFTNGTLVNNVSGDATWLIYIALIMGLLLFAHKAPKMLGELFPKMGAASGNFGINMKDRPGVARAAGMTLGASLVGARKLVGAGVNRYKRNRQNKEKRAQNKEEFQNKDEAYKNARQERNRLRRQNRTGDKSLMVAERDANGEIVKDANGRVKMRKITDVKEKQRILAQADKDLRDKERDRASAKAAVNNTKYRATALSALAGGVTGVVQGATQGAKATDAKGIVKQVKEGFKTADASLAKTEKWYDEGGGSYFDRAVTSVEHAFGITTASGQITRDIKQIDEQIKSNEVLINAESDTKSKRDDVEKRLESKLESGELKTTIDDEGLAYLQSKVPGVAINKGEKLSDVYARTRVATESAQSNLDNIIKAKGEGSIEASNAKIALKEARDNETKMKKHAMRAAYTYMLQNPNATDINDGVAVGKLNTMKESIKIANRNQQTVNEFIANTNQEKEEAKLQARKAAIKEAQEQEEKVLGRTLTETEKENIENRINTTLDTSAIENKYNRQINAFAGIVSFKDYDELDEIVTRLQNMADARMRDNMAHKETKRRIEASDATAAAKADNSAAGGK